MSSPGNGGNQGGNSSQTTYTQSELNDMTISEIMEIANERGYTKTSTLKADIIQEFLDQQNS